MSFVAVVVGGVTAGAGIYSANKAAGAQKDAANGAKKLAKQQFERQDALNLKMYRQNQGDAEATFKGTNQNAAWAGANANKNALDLFRAGNGLARGTRQQNLDRLDFARDDGTARIKSDRNANIRDFRGAEAANLGDAAHARDAGLGRLNPAITAGNSALQAYGSNLGIGSAPAGYSGLTLSPGAQFQLEQGRNTVEGGAAGSGGLYSGATLAQLERMRNGEVSMDRDNQQAQLFGLAGMGQNAIGQANGLDSAYADRAGGIRDLASGRVADTRNNATSGTNALNGNYATQSNGVSDDYFDRTYGNAANYTNALTNSSDTLAGRNMNALDQRMSNLFNARTNRQNLLGSASNNYVNSATDAINNRGAATAAGSIGVGNAITSGVNNGLGIYSMMGGFNGGSGGTSFSSNGTAPVNNNWLAGRQGFSSYR